MTDLGTEAGVIPLDALGVAGAFVMEPASRELRGSEVQVGCPGCVEGLGGRAPKRKSLG